MSDATTEPGAPAAGATNLPAASEKSVAGQVKKNAPPQLLSLARTPDRIILRLNKLLATPGGLSAFLSTFNYSLWLLAYVEAKSAPLQARIYQLVNRLAGKPLFQPATPVAGASSIAALATLISSTRTTLRLFGLLPMYAGLRRLLQGPKPGQDPVLYATAVAQLTLYMAFQFLENVGLLTDHKVLPASYTARWADKTTGRPAKIYLWSYRAWLGGVLCDVVRLAREAQLERGRRATRTGTTHASTLEEEKKADAKWWNDLVIPLSWLPVAVQFSSETGFSWFNLGIMGVCGMSAGLGKTASLWQETADA